MTDKTTASQSPHPDRQGNRAGYRARLQGTFLPSLLDRSASTLGRSHAPMLDRLQTTTENIVGLIYTPGVSYQGARRREGGYPACSAASDFRWKADVRTIQPPLSPGSWCFLREASLLTHVYHIGPTIRPPRNITSRVVRRCTWSLPFVEAINDLRPMTHVSRDHEWCGWIIVMGGIGGLLSVDAWNGRWEMRGIPGRWRKACPRCG